MLSSSLVFTPQYNLKNGQLFILSLTDDKTGSERVSHLPKITQLGSDKASAQTQVCSIKLQSPVPTLVRLNVKPPLAPPTPQDTLTDSKSIPITEECLELAYFTVMIKPCSKEEK